MWRRGDRIEARRLSIITKNVNALKESFGAPRQRSGAENQTIPVTKRFRVVSLETDYLVCNEWNGIEQGGVEILVAMPYLLRRSPFDGLSRNQIAYSYLSDSTRTASGAAGEETQVITPSYVSDDEIVALKNVSGGVGVIGPDDPLEWIDINVDARAWAEQV